MGHFGDPSQPKVQETIRIIESKVLAEGKALATTTGTWKVAQELFERDYHMLMLLADGVSLAKLAASKVNQFKENYPDG